MGAQRGTGQPCPITGLIGHWCPIQTGHQCPIQMGHWCPTKNTPLRIHRRRIRIRPAPSRGKQITGGAGRRVRAGMTPDICRRIGTCSSRSYARVVKTRQRGRVVKVAQTLIFRRYSPLLECLADSSANQSAHAKETAPVARAPPISTRSPHHAAGHGRSSPR